MFNTKQRIAVRSSVDKGKVRKKVLSSFQTSTISSGGYTSGANINVSAPGMFSQQKDSLLIGIVPTSEEASLRPFYRDIYDFDQVSGAAVDLMSTLPFSDWTLLGAPDSQLDIFHSATERLNLKVLLPEISIDYLVLGLFTGTLVYKKEQKKFTDIIPHNPDNIEQILSPLYGADPLLILKVPKETREFVNSNNPYFIKLRERLSDHMLKSMRSSRVELDNLTTLYIPRKTYTTSKGTSLYRRILPIWLLEKILYRGTLTESTRRQRSILHITAGDEFWEPTEEDLQNLVTLFQQADLDPIGAMVATRNDIQTNELRPGGDFWKYTDIIEYTTAMKLRGLGISETFLSGDATYATMEVSLSVFIEHIRSYREMLTKKIFTNKLFPLISVIHGLYRKDLKQEGRHIEKGNVNPYYNGRQTTYGSGLIKLTPDDIQYEMSDTSKLVIPQLHWHKALRPEADQDYLNILNTLTEQGVPITLRMWAAAGGISIDNLLGDLEEDKIIRKQITEFKKTLSAKGISTNSEEGEGEESGEEIDETIDYGDEENTDDSGINALTFASNALNRRPKPLLARDYGKAVEVIGRTRTGKPKYILNQRKANRDLNEKMAKALHNLSDEATFRLRQSQVRE